MLFRQLLQELQGLQEQFTAFMRHLPAGVFVKDQDGSFLYVNNYLKERFDAEKWLGRNIAEILPRQLSESMLADDPQDQFLRYSLAMELQKEGDHERSIQLLAGLTADEEPYGAAFFMLAKQLVPLGRLNEARDALRAGIELARRRGDGHRRRGR